MNTRVFDQIRALTTVFITGAGVALAWDVLSGLLGQSPAARFARTLLMVSASSALLFVILLRTGEGPRPLLLCAAGAGGLLYRLSISPILFDAIKFIKQFLRRKE